MEEPESRACCTGKGTATPSVNDEGSIRSLRCHSWPQGHSLDHLVPPSVKSSSESSYSPSAVILYRSNRLAQVAIETTLEIAYEVFHDKLQSVPGCELKFNFGQCYRSPRACSGLNEIYPGPRCMSNINELIGREFVLDPKTSKMRKAYKVHIKGRHHDDRVWSSDLEMDRRYSTVVKHFEDSLSILGTKIKSLKWAATQLKALKNKFKYTLQPKAAQPPRPACQKRIYIDQDENGEDIIVFR